MRSRVGLYSRLHAHHRLSSSNDTLEFQTLKTTEHNEIHRWAPDIPRNMTFMLRLDTGSPIIGDRAPKPTRYESSGAPETCEHSFQVTLPPKEPSEKDPEEDACFSQSSTSEDVSDSPDPSTPDEMYFEHCLPFPGMLSDPGQFGPWPVGNPSDAMLLDSAQFPYPFLPEYPPNHLVTPGTFTFEDCSVNFSGQQPFLGDSGSSCSFSFPPDLRPTLDDNWATLERQNSAGYTPDVMGPASFNGESVDLPGLRSGQTTAQQSRPTSARRGNQRSVSSQQNKRGRKKPATTEDHSHQPSRRSSNKEHEPPAVSKNSSDRQPKSKKMRKIAPAEPNVHPGRPPALPLLPSLPSIFPPEWYGSNILEKRFLGEHGRNYVPIRPAPPAFEPILPSMPPSAYSNYIPPAPYPPATPDRQNTQAAFPAPSPNTTLRPAVWPFPPPVPMHPDARHGPMPQYPPMPFVYGPGYFPPPPFGFMGPPFPFQYPRGESWTEHFDLLQDELQERRRLQKIQDRFVDPRKPQKRRSLYYPCPLCDRSFLRRNSLALHIKWHYDPREGECSYDASPSIYLIHCLLQSRI